jgi:hypothetical protein
MRTSTAILAAALLVAISAVSATAAPAKTAKLSAPEAKWVSPVAKIWNAMNAGLLVVYRQTTADQALIPGTKANGALNQTLGAFVLCKKLMVAAKAPPTNRLKPFASSMNSACGHLNTGAHGVANGIGTIYKKHNAKLGAAQIERAFTSFQKGSGSLATARKQLLKFGGSGALGGS